jgi:aryl-alcohol dehydrogenase-like predicted oxidoreductase
MQRRKLVQGVEVPPFAFGGNVFGWTADEQTSFKLLDAFTGAGFTLIDTADGYSTWVPGNKGGESETIIGNWLKKKGGREKMIIATKVGGDMGRGICLKKDYVIKSAEDSLRRLQTDYIDLYQSHWDDLSTPVGETLEAFAQLVQQGKVRAIGASNLSPERLRASLEFSKQNGLPAYQTLQPEYNLYDREYFEKEYLPVCKEYHLTVINYFSLAAGFLTGKYRSEKDASKSVRGGTIVKKYLNKRGLRILNALDDLSARYKTSPAAIAFAWLLTRPHIAAPIASATSTEQLQELLKATTLELDKDAIELLDGASRYS